MAISKIINFLKAWVGPDEPSGSAPVARESSTISRLPRSSDERVNNPDSRAEAGTLAAVRGGGKAAGNTSLARLRFRGARGGMIARHRSMRTVEMPRGEIFISIGLAVVATGLWLLVLPLVMALWKAIFDFSGGLLALPGQTRVERYHLGPVGFSLPSISLPSQTPDATMWWITAIVTVVLFLASYLLMRRSVPLAYMLRAILFVQLTALIFFYFFADRYPYGLEDYMANLLMASLTFLTFVPIILSLTYYIFDVGLLKKLSLTLLVLAHLCVLVPLQYLIHAYIIYQGSLLFMPVLYLVFGLPLDIMSLIAFYAWGMSWQSRGSRSAT